MVSAALDGYAANSVDLGLWNDVIEAATRRLAAPQLHAQERKDALHVMALGYWHQSDFDAALRITREAIAAIRPGDPITHLELVLWDGVMAAYRSGRWADLEALMPVAHEIREQVAGAAAPGLVQTYVFWLMIAMARDDWASADAALAAVRQLTQLGVRSGLAAVSEALREDDPSLLDFGPEALTHEVAFILWVLNERGLAPADAVIDYAESRLQGEASTFAFRVEVARAIRDRDPERLAAAIAEVDARRWVPDGARLRIVLAEMTGDPAPLEQARPVLERVGDRQFLRRLEEVAASLR
jgi:hypothetical protein